MTNGEMGTHTFACSACIYVCILIAFAVGMPDSQGQFAKSIPAPSSNQLHYSRPPVQFLEKEARVPRNVGNGNQLQVGQVGNQLNVAKAVPYGPSYTNVVNRPGDGPSYDKGNFAYKGSPINNVPISSNIPDPLPVRSRSPQTFNQRLPDLSRSPDFSRSVKNSNPIQAPPINIGSNQRNLYGDFDYGQNANSNNNNFYNPVNAIEPRRQTQNGNSNYNNPILTKGFYVPSTYTGQVSQKPAPSETLYAVANPMQDKREIIGSYVPRNDFVNPEMFAIPTEDKHNIVNRIFGGFKTPGFGNEKPLPVNVNQGRNDAGFFNKQNAARGPSNQLFNEQRQFSNNALDARPRTDSKNNIINTVNSAGTNFPQNDLNKKPTTFNRPPQNKLNFNGGHANPGTFPGVSTTLTKAEPIPINVFPATKNSQINLNNEGSQINAFKIKPAANSQFDNKAASFGNKGFDLSSSSGRNVQTSKPSLSKSPRQPSNFNSFDSFGQSDLFSNPRSGFGGSFQAFDNGANNFNSGDLFANRHPPPKPLFSDFSQSKPLSVNDFRSKNLLSDNNFGKSEYDLTRPSSSNFLPNENKAFQAQNLYQGNSQGNFLGNDNFGHFGNDNFGADSGLSGFKQVGGKTTTTGNSYDNVRSQNQGYNKQFDDSNNILTQKPSSFAKQGRSSNTYQNNDGFNRAGSFNDGADYAKQYKFKDGDSINNQRSSEHNDQKDFRKSFEDQQQATDKDSYSNADGYNNAYVNGRKYDLSDGYTDNVNYNKENSNSDQRGYDDQNGYQRGVAKVGNDLDKQRSKLDLYANLPTSVSKGLPKESSYKPFNVNKPIFGGSVLH